MAIPRPRDEPITLERIERCLDRLAMIMSEDEALARRVAPIFKWLDEEAQVLRDQDDVLANARARANGLATKGKRSITAPL